ncbi:MAG: type VII secretion integral membrane protein EccD [Frankia sp.]
MPAESVIGLARVVVVAPGRQVDLAIPDQVPLAALLPAVLEHAGEDVVDGAGGHGGWSLRRRDGVPLDVGKSAAAQNVVDGETLFLVLSSADWPEPEYDDVVEAIAASARSGGMLWDARISRAVAVAVSGCLVAVALALCLLHGPDWTGPALAGLGLSAGCLLAGAVLARVFGLPVHAVAFSAYGLVAASVAGVLLLGGSDPLRTFGAPHLLTAGLALFVASLLATLTGATRQWLFVAAAAVAVFGSAAAALALTSLNASKAAGALTAILFLALPAWPALAVRLGNLPLPVLPRSAADLVRDRPLPPAAAMAAGVARADQWLTGLLVGASLTSSVGLVVLSLDGGTATRVLVAVIGVLYLLRAPIFPTVRHRLPPLVCGVTALAALTASAIGPGGGAVPRAALALGIGALLAAFLGVWYADRHPSVYLARAGEVVETVLLVSVVPVACAVFGLYTYMRGVGG